ncbi:TPA: GPW/gp25 family protein [Escherichia coli]|nr:GPW/gp25 family protein [Escherichia coli]
MCARDITADAVTGSAQLHQSVCDIITTPVGSRIMRRSYGSLVPALLGAPDNPVTLLRLVAAAAIAIYQWEPRVQPVSITTEDTGGQRRLNVIVRRTDSGRTEQFGVDL